MSSIFRPTTLSNVWFSDIEMLQFMWQNRFIVPSYHDGVIGQDTAHLSVMLTRDLEDFGIPENILALQEQLEDKGYVFKYAAENDSNGCFKSDFPFGSTFAGAARVNSPLEHLFTASIGGEIIGGALVSLPGAPTDWVNYGCDCGLFGPTGVAQEHRGGIGKVLLFNTINKLKELNCSRALVPTNATIYPFYLKAGFGVYTVEANMRRKTGHVDLKIK
jgi:hypothetical protein